MNDLEFYFIDRVLIYCPEEQMRYVIAVKVKSTKTIVALFNSYETALRYAEELDNDPF